MGGITIVILVCVLLGGGREGGFVFLDWMEVV